MLRTILTDWLGIGYQFAKDKDELLSYKGPRIAYSDEHIDGCLNIRPHNILFDHGIRDYHLEVQNHEVFRKIFFRNGGTDIPFDLFGAAFWLLSRYEEYLPFKGDAHDRFQPRSSLAYQYEFLEMPLVNAWVKTLSEILVARFPGLMVSKREYSFVSTIDVDNVYKFRHKGFVRTMAGFISDRSFSRIRERLEIMIGRKPDPFDCYDFVLAAHRATGVAAIFFFLLGDYGPNDKNHSASDLRFQSLIKHVSDYARVGVHPSYGSNSSLRQLKVEFARLGNITHRLITRSRQHFSMLRFPKTYDDLIQAGITADYSMGYPNLSGFRASCCTPYKWYNLNIESITPLTVHPYCITDHGLGAEAKRTGKSMLEIARSMREVVSSYGGEFIALFHNDNFDEEIRAFYLPFLEMAREGADIRQRV